MFERNRSKKVELLAKVYDHAKHKYRFGFRMLTLGWSDGSTFLPVNSILLSTESKKNRINEAAEVDKRTIGYKRRKLSMEKGTHAMLALLETAKKLQSLQNMFFSTVGFHHRVPFMLSNEWILM